MILESGDISFFRAVWIQDKAQGCIRCNFRFGHDFMYGVIYVASANEFDLTRHVTVTGRADKLLSDSQRPQASSLGPHHRLVKDRQDRHAAGCF
jgi:hypothetical protein